MFHMWYSRTPIYRPPKIEAKSNIPSFLLLTIFNYTYNSGPKIAANSNIPAFLLLTEQGRYIGVRLYLVYTGKGCVTPTQPPDVNVGSVIGQEVDEGVVGNTGVIQGLKDPPHLMVHLDDAVAVGSVLDARPLLKVQAFLWAFWKKKTQVRKNSGFHGKLRFPRKNSGFCKFSAYFTFIRL